MARLWISMAADGEAGDIERAALDEHLEICEDCVEWRALAEAVVLHVRTTPPSPVPAGLLPELPRRRSPRRGFALRAGGLVAAAAAAAVLGIAAAIPLAWFAAYNMTPSRRFLYPVARLFIMACRSVHEMIWTILLVALLGFGMLPGALALTLFCIGFAGKLFSEAVEAIELGQVEAIRSTGANALQVFVFAVLPQVRVAWTGITIYTWDVVFRAATVVGFFGAGGMGWYLRESVQRVASRDVAAILLSIIVVVVISELLSAWLRNRIAKAIA